MLRLQAIGKTFSVPGVIALADVSFEILRGEIHALTGESGAGKSTLMKILSGVHADYSGEILLDEVPLTVKNPRQAQRLGIAMVYQERTLVPELSIAENIFLGREPRTLLGTIDRRKMHRESTDLLRQLDPGIDPRRPVSSLRVGQQQLVDVAKALSLEPRLLILDEPASALTPAEVNRLFKVIRDLKAEHVTIIYIGRRLDEIFTLADTITVLRDGRHVATMPRSSAKQPDLIKLMLGREPKEHYPRPTSTIGNGVLHAEFLGYSPPSPLKRSLTRVNFSLHAGEVLGVAGLTGSGRTELLETIFGLYPRWQITGGLLLAESGRYKPLRSPGSALKNGIAYVPADRETRCLVPTRSVSENITLSSLTSLGTAGFLWARREQSVVHDAMQRLRIRITDPHARVGQLSAGDQQKIALARCLLTRPQILLLDEPTQGIDISAKAEIYNLIAQLAARGTAILMASSDLPELLAMCDRILVLQDGTLTASLHGPSTSQSEIMTAASRGN